MLLVSRCCVDSGPQTKYTTWSPNKNNGKPEKIRLDLHILNVIGLATGYKPSKFLCFHRCFSTRRAAKNAKTSTLSSDLTISDSSEISTKASQSAILSLWNSNARWRFSPGGGWWLWRFSPWVTTRETNNHLFSVSSLAFLWEVVDLESKVIFFESGGPIGFLKQHLWRDGMCT